MKPRLDMDKIAKGLGAERRGKVPVSGGYFGAMQLVSDIQARFRAPARGGRATDPAWTERRLIPLASQTLRRLQQLAQRTGEKRKVRVEPMQMAALLLEKTVESITEQDAEELFQPRTGRR